MRGEIMDKNIIKEFNFVYEENSGKIRVLNNHGYEISPESGTAIIEGIQGICKFK